MADTIGPAPQFEERAPYTYERKVVPALPGERGPVRFYEGVASDTDVPTEFQKGVLQGYVTAPGRMNHNANVYEKYPEETLRERAHVGSAAWVESQTFLGEFASGAFVDHGEYKYDMLVRDGSRYERQSPATVND